MTAQLAFDPSTLVEKEKYTIVQQNGYDWIEYVEAELIAANIGAVMIRPRGKSNSTLIKAEQVVSITHVPAGPKKIKQKVLAEVGLDKARQHLVDAHGYAVSVINGITNEQGLATHNSIDHADLGHRHKSADEADVVGGDTAGE